MKKRISAAAIAVGLVTVLFTGCAAGQPTTASSTAISGASASASQASSTAALASTGDTAAGALENLPTL